MKLILAILYILMPTVLASKLMLDNYFITGHHAHLSELGIVLVFFYALLKESCENRSENIIMAISFLGLLFADLVYTFTVMLPNRESLLIVQVSNFGYTVLMLGQTILVLRDILFFHFRKEPWSLAIIVLLAVAFNILNMKYITMPIIEKGGFATTFQIAHDIFYSFLSSVICAVFIPYVFRSVNFHSMSYGLMFLLMCMSDFAIRMQTASAKSEQILYGFEHGWEIGVASIFMLVLWKRKAPGFKSTDIAPLRSLRAMLALAIAASLFISLVLMFIVRLFQLRDAYNLTNFLLIILATVLWSNAIALYFSLSVTNISSLVDEPLKKITEALSPELADHRFPYVSHTTKIEEIDSVINKYNIVAKKANQLIEEVIEKSRLAAISRTTQMLAHDVRKPFSIIKLGLDQLCEAKDMMSIRNILKIFIPEIDKSLRSVQGMINDIMEVGRAAAPKMENVAIESILESTLSDLCRVYENTDIQINYEFAHKHMLNVDSLKMSRVFANIIGNAFQAMNYSGSLWIRTTEEEGMMTVCIGNSGSFISEDDMHDLFEAFFTKNKHGGTGLGLAIAHKIITSHGGRIWCESSSEKRTVEFFFTLPTDITQQNRTTSILFKNTKDIREEINISTLSFPQGEDAVFNVIDHTIYEKTIQKHSQELGRKIKIAIIDDEAVYRNSLKELIEKNDNVKNYVESRFFSSSSSLLEAFSSESFDFLICDIDLGPDSLDGYEILRRIRIKGHKTIICVHSNRSLPEDYTMSIELGAQSFLTKPMTYLHFLKFISSTLPI
ncbi:MAG: hybrid sensor histidine kinase/response regulator [Oligoflexales bacterium]|nr:hybrid sensor histidine kinase/response regulator [Oligoflexales bacterium]